MKKLIAWFDIPSTNFDRAVKFYNNVLDVDIKVFDYGDEKMGCFPEDDSNISGSIFYSPDHKPSSNGTILSFHAGNDLNIVLEKVKKFGGKVKIAKTKIEAENRGYFATFLDSEGNCVGLYSDN